MRYTVKKVSGFPVPSRDVTYQITANLFYSVEIKYFGKINSFRSK
jgi:hypothetical protein